MAIFEIIMPKMGESIIEATNIKWLKKPDTDIKPDITYHVPTETGCLISDDLATPTRFYSPLVKSIAKKVNIALQKLEKKRTPTLSVTILKKLMVSRFYELARFLPKIPLFTTWIV
jgi:hypothetical protein